MNKREERDHKFKLLFSAQFYPGAEVPEQLKHYFESPDYEDGNQVIHIEELTETEEWKLKDDVEKILAVLPELDARIDSMTEGWTTRRMSKTDLTILRLALYEMEHDEAVPEKVSINEAVELAKKYGGPESGSFVNGVLARILRNEQPAAGADRKPGKEKKGELTEKKQGGKKMHILINK